MSYLSESPLVSILINTYNRPALLRLALESVLQQTYQNFEVIIGDDSTNEDTRNLIAPYCAADPRIKYFNNGGCRGDYGFENAYRCFSYANGTYINFLNDDDLFMPNKLEKMVNCFQNYPTVTLATSTRQLIDENGAALPHRAHTAPITPFDSIFEGKEIIRRMSTQTMNFLGEPSVVMFRRSALHDYASFNHRKYLSMVDVPMWVQLLSQGNCMYFTEPLTCIRLHPSQNTHQKAIFIFSLLEWLYLIVDSSVLGLISYNDYLEAFGSLKKHLSYIKEFYTNPESQPMILERLAHLNANPESQTTHFLKHNLLLRLLETRNFSAPLSPESSLLTNSNFFDEVYYYETNPDVATANIDPLTHYCLYGWSERRNPNRNFETHFYLEEYPDVAAAGINPLWHYLAYGRSEGRICKKV